WVPTGRTDSPEAKRNLVERSRPRPRVPRATEGAGDDSTHFNRAASHRQQAFGNLYTVECCALADLVAGDEQVQPKSCGLAGVCADASN
ncbi:MAG: hypothetical protein RL254_511, partial [Planctomycetota bacterium]